MECHQQKFDRSRTHSNTDRLYYLEQYTSGDAKELVISCHHLPPDEGYNEARRLLKKKFGDEYRVTLAYETNALAWPSIKPEDGSALQFAVFLSSCTNALAISQYSSKFDQPGNIQKLVFKLPFSTRERWCRCADDIMEIESRPAKYCDLVTFVDCEVRIATNPVFGNISANAQPSSDQRSRRTPQLPAGFKPSKTKTSTFVTQVKDNKDANSEQSTGGYPTCHGVQPNLCPFCQKNHALEDCHVLRWKPYQERIKFLSTKRLCFGCLSANTDKCPKSSSEEARGRTAMAVIPVKVRLRANNRTVITHAFLHGSSVTFYTESLIRKLEVERTKVKISLSTLEKKNSPVESYLIRDLVESDLDDIIFEEDIPTQEDVDQWPHLDGVFIPRFDAEIGLLIGSNVPEALDPVEIRHGENSGPYASRTRIGWAVNGPCGHCRHGSEAVSSFVKFDPQLQHMVDNFYNRDFSDSFADV
nr:uncharacterized protein LOC131791925 [Pocillopora verrucosa]